MKILYVTTVGGTMTFFKSFICELIDDGNIVDIATNENGGKTSVLEEYRMWGCRIYPISCSRSPMNVGNLRAIGQIKRLVKKNEYDIVHCHTPIAAACTRLACKGWRRKGLKVFYTAHGFHFYTGAPLKNWLVYYPVEWLTSFWTDVLITINKEDFERASRHLQAKKTVYVPGIGVDTTKFGAHYDGNKIREELGIGGFMLLSVGELNENKNHESVIRAIAGLDITYVIVGSGGLDEYLKQVAGEYQSRLILTGYRCDVANFYDTADAYILPSFREGLNMSLMEAMASGLPCLASRIRGNTDLLDEEGGVLFAPNSVYEIRNAIEKVMTDSTGMGAHNRQRINQFDLSIVNDILKHIYIEEVIRKPG